MKDMRSELIKAVTTCANEKAHIPECGCVLREFRDMKTLTAINIITHLPDNDVLELYDAHIKCTKKCGAIGVKK